MDFSSRKSIIFALAASGIMLLAVISGYLVVTAKSDVVLTTTASMPDMRNLIRELDKQQIEYRLTDDGSVLNVDKKDVKSAKSILHNSAGPDNKIVGLEIFEKSDFGITEFAQKVNYKRALEGELSRTVAGFSGVNHARVHLAIPEKTFFKGDAKRGSGSVTLFLAEGATLSESDVTGIKSLVAHSVTGIEASDVIVMDQSGRLYSEGAATRAHALGDNLKESKERYLRDKIAEFLSGAYPLTRHSIGVNIDINTSDKKIVERTMIPLSGSRGAIKNSKVSIDSTSDKGKSGKVVEESYEFGSRLEEMKKPAGEVVRISVAVFVDSSMEADVIDFIRSSIEAIAGVDINRGDTVVVKGNATKTQMDMPEFLSIESQEALAVNENTNENIGLLDIPFLNSITVSTYQLTLVCLLLMVFILVIFSSFMLLNRKTYLTERQETELRDILSEIKG